MGRKRQFNKSILIIGSLVAIILLFAAGRMGQGRAGKATQTQMEAAADDQNLVESIRKSHPQTTNIYTKLWVPTMVKTIDDLCFIVDSYHNQILVNTAGNFGTPLNEWQTLSGEFKGPHTISGDGQLFLVDDTENDRAEVFLRTDEMKDGIPQFQLVQVFPNTGHRPHYTWYDPDTHMFYLWSSQTGEMYIFARNDESSRPRLTLRGIHKFEEMQDTYVRSFTVNGGSMWFVSGVSLGLVEGDRKQERLGYKSRILQYSMPDLKLVREYPVPDEITGMVQLLPDPDKDGAWYFSVSTDRGNDQSKAGFFHADSLDKLMKGLVSTAESGVDESGDAAEPAEGKTGNAAEPAEGKTGNAAESAGGKTMEPADGYTEIWDQAITGGAPYFFSEMDARFVTAAGDNTGHAVWTFGLEAGKIVEPEGRY